MSKFDRFNAAHAERAEDRLEALRHSLDTHRMIRELFGMAPDEGVAEAIASRFHLPEWVTGSIALAEAMFLADFMAGVRPRRVIEIGVAGGGSTAAMLIGLDEAGVPIVDDAGEPVVHGYDTLPNCYFANDKPLGAIVLEKLPQLARGMRIHTPGTARTALEHFRDDPADFAFVDGDHRHPFPTLDVLTLAPALRPGAWIVLHDIRLRHVADEYEQRMGEKVGWRAVGPEALIDAWPFETVRGGLGCDNMGAIRLPEDRPLSLDDVRASLDVPWEGEVPEGTLARLNLTQPISA